VPRNNPGYVSRLRDLGRPGVRLVLAASQVPAGKYARAALAAMAHDAAFGPRFLARAMANVASNETDVKAVVAKVVLGEADAGVVYVTDVTAQVTARVHTIAIPARFNQIAPYPIAVVKGSRNPALARTFVAYVLSPAGQSVLRRSGFITTGTAGDPRSTHPTRVVSATVVRAS
jgi:molybdate transport system substrate-binding protein